LEKIETDWYRFVDDDLTIMLPSLDVNDEFMSTALHAIAFKDSFCRISISLGFGLLVKLLFFMYVGGRA
jgi:hypothetical protein